MINRYNSINALLKGRFGERVYKVVLETGCGCPNRDGTLSRSGCLFCHPDALRPHTAKDPALPPKPIPIQLEEGIEYIRGRHGTGRVISYLQNGSNTYAPADRLVPIFESAIAHPSVVGLAVSTRPDCIDAEQVELLADVARRTMLWVELGLQSAHEETLVRIGRGHTVVDFGRASRMLAHAGIPVCAHVILGLPGETPEMMLDTARYLNDAGVWGAKIHNLHVLRGTGLERDYNDGLIELLSLEEYAERAVDFLEVLSPGIVIHRLGSHSPRDLTVTPDWSVNKLATLNAVHAELERRDTRQGRLFERTLVR